MQTYFPVSEFVSQIQKFLRDEVGFDFSVQDEILPVLNDATAEIVNTDPQAVVFNVNFQLQSFNVAILDPGAGYADGDTITLAGGTGTAGVLTVQAATAGAIDQVSISNQGDYTVYPTNPVSQASSSGTGTGAQFTLVPNGGKQELPPDAASLVDVRRNMGADGQTIGNIIKNVSKDDIDAVDDTWTTHVCGVNGMPTDIVEYIADDRDPKRFYTWPQKPGWWVELIYRSVPNNVGLTDNFPLPALYMPAAKYYVIANVLSRLDDNDKRRANAQPLIARYDAMFLRALGAATAATAATIPSTTVNRDEKPAMTVPGG